MYTTNTATNCHQSLLKAMFDPSLFESGICANKPHEKTTATIRPASQIKKMDTSYLLIVDLPGVSKENIHVETHGGLLKVRAHRENFENEKFHYEVQFKLPGDCQHEQIKAQLSNGVLSLELPKHTPQPVTLTIL